MYDEAKANRPFDVTTIIEAEGETLETEISSLLSGRNQSSPPSIRRRPLRVSNSQGNGSQQAGDQPMVKASRPETAGQAQPDIPEDAINPSHYRKHPSGIECIEVTRHMNFNVGNAIKYLWRYMDKGDPVENLKKAQWYIDDEIRRLEGKR